MTCEHFSQLILDDAKDAALEAHLAGCASCTELRRAHAAARALRGVVPRWRPISRARVLRRAGALLLVVCAAVGVLASRPGAPALIASDAGALPVEGQLSIAPSPADQSAEAEWNALIDLHQAVALTSRRDLRVVDFTYAAFGALPEWVAQPSLQPIRSLGPAVSPLVYTPED